MIKTPKTAVQIWFLNEGIRYIVDLTSVVSNYKCLLLHTVEPELKVTPLCTWCVPQVHKFTINPLQMGCTPCAHQVHLV